MLLSLLGLLQWRDARQRASEEIYKRVQTNNRRDEFRSSYEFAICSEMPEKELTAGSTTAEVQR